ncbi:MAG: hypothetical protein JWQ35_1722 [Bacteriovoracaceae bacterium]|nr:hypothetical protein [Bacteriovoracaceae bacterium]
MARSQTQRKILKSLKTKEWLDGVLGEFNRSSYIYSDPLKIVHSYQTKEDQELTALIAALFSFGNVVSILYTVERLLEPLGEHPHQKLLSLKDKDFREIWGKSYYRFYSSTDIIFLFRRLQKILKDVESFESAFVQNWNEDMIETLFKFRILFTKDAPKSGGVRFMFANPKEGCAKRWHMFLRWMVRKDEVDLGLWSRVPKSHLIQPLDTHLFQIGRALKLTERKTPSLLAALQMTERFKEWDPEDPIKYDFALCRLGVLRQKNDRLKVFNPDVS